MVSNSALRAGPSDKKLTKAQRRFMDRLNHEEGFGPIRHMTYGERRTGHALKLLGMVVIDGAISSSVTEGNASYNGCTFVPA